MANGMFALMIMGQSWEDASMHATTMRLAKISVWTSLKLANLIALAK